MKPSTTTTHLWTSSGDLWKEWWSWCGWSRLEMSCINVSCEFAYSYCYCSLVAVRLSLYSLIRIPLFCNLHNWIQFTCVLLSYACSLRPKVYFRDLFVYINIFAIILLTITVVLRGFQSNSQWIFAALAYLMYSMLALEYLSLFKYVGRNEVPSEILTLLLHTC